MTNKTYYPSQLKPAKLFIITSLGVQTYDFNRKLTLGRTTKYVDPDIRLTHDFVSRQHGVFDIDAQGLYYMDTCSGNGTYYNENLLTTNQKQYLTNGNVLKISRTKVQTITDIVRIIFVTDYSAQYEWCTLSNLENISEISIGRNHNNSLELHNENISLNHACLFFMNDCWNIIDYNSTNGIYVNGKRMVDQCSLTIGDCISLANINFIFMGTHFIYQSLTDTNNNLVNKENSLSIQIVEKNVWYKAKKLMLLQDINLTISNGELVLILGGSGAGKTTFMNAVMGYEKAEGTIIHENHDIYREYHSIKHKIGFVPQLDLLRAHDTVYDTLKNAAEMKLSANISDYDRDIRISTVLNTLGLQREQYSLVSKLSGGQRKRLSIAVEYISDPCLFFLDEPDSGLDGIMAKSLMQNLRSIADENKIVMVISHSPDRVANLFDKIIVLAKSTRDNCGHLAFFGSVNDSLAFFNCSSLEEIVQRINRCDEGGDGLSDYYIDKYRELT